MDSLILLNVVRGTGFYTINKKTINFIEETKNISRSTTYRYLRKEGVDVKGFKKQNKQNY